MFHGVKRPAAASLVFIGLLLVAPSQAMAGAFTIAPVRVELHPAKRTEALTVRNEEDHPVLIQLATYAWSQVEGEDRLEATMDALATPPVFTLPAGGQQIVRVALRRAAAPDRELQYRLVLQEVPPESPVGFSGLKMALQLSLPIFVRPAGAVSPVLHWRARHEGDDRLTLIAENTGNAHAQIIDFELASDGRADQSVEGMQSRYVLPGSRVHWTMKVPVGAGVGSSLTLRANSDRGPIAAAVPVAAR
jgi:fimbrial chaperone protein